MALPSREIWTKLFFTGVSGTLLWKRIDNEWAQTVNFTLKFIRICPDGCYQILDGLFNTEIEKKSATNILNILRKLKKLLREPNLGIFGSIFSIYGEH